jgi:hypothetical protein
MTPALAARAQDRGSAENSQNYIANPQGVPLVLEQSTGGYQESALPVTAFSVLAPSPPRNMVRITPQLMAAHGRYLALSPATPNPASDSQQPEGNQIPETTQAPKVQQSSAQRPATPGPSEPSPQTEEEAECIICMNPFSTRSMLQPCGHEFDFDCVLPWLDSLFVKHYDVGEVKCPLCRGAVEFIQHDHRPEGISQRFIIGRRFRAYNYRERREGGHGPMPPTLPSAFYDLAHGVGVPSLTRPSAMAPWERQALLLRLAARGQTHIESQQLEAQQIQRNFERMLGELQSDRELEDMGESLSNDLDVRGRSLDRESRVPPTSNNELSLVPWYFNNEFIGLGPSLIVGDARAGLPVLINYRESSTHRPSQGH